PNKAKIISCLKSHADGACSSFDRRILSKQRKHGRADPVCKSAFRNGTKRVRINDKRLLRGGNPLPHSCHGASQLGSFVIGLKETEKESFSHQDASRQYAAVSTIAVSRTPCPRSATTVGRAT